MSLTNNLPDNFEYTYFSLTVLSQSIAEMETLAKRRPPYELNLFNGHLGQFYYFTITYAFVMEFCKLMEPRVKGSNKHYASLQRLNWKVYNLKGKSYFKAFNEIETSICSLRCSPFYSFIKNDLRDKRFAHTDKSQAKPFYFPPLTDEQMRAAKDACNVMWLIQNKAAESFKEEFSNHVDDTTENTITLYGAYYKYCVESGKLIQILNGS